jgi:hypothetical protein
MLLSAGAATNYRNGNRANARDIAESLHREAVAALLTDQ